MVPFPPSPAILCFPFFLFFGVVSVCLLHWLRRRRKKRTSSVYKKRKEKSRRDVELICLSLFRSLEPTHKTDTLGSLQAFTASRGGGEGGCTFRREEEGVGGKQVARRIPGDAAQTGDYLRARHSLQVRSGFVSSVLRKGERRRGAAIHPFPEEEREPSGFAMRIILRGSHQICYWPSHATALDRTVVSITKTQTLDRSDLLIRLLFSLIIIS